MNTKKIAAAIALLKKHNYKISKIERKQKSNMSIAVASTVGPVAKQMLNDPKIKNVTLRQILLKTASTKYFNDVLDEYFKGTKRLEFDDITRKQYNTAKTLVQDIEKVGKFKRFKLLERYNIFNLELLITMFTTYRPPNDRVVVRKRKYKKVNSQK